MAGKPCVRLEPLADAGLFAGWPPATGLGAKPGTKPPAERSCSDPTAGGGHRRRGQSVSPNFLDGVKDALKDKGLEVEAASYLKARSLCKKCYGSLHRVVNLAIKKRQHRHRRHNPRLCRRRKAKAKAKAKRSAGSQAKPKPEPKPEPEEVEICKLEPKPEPEEVEIRKLEWPAEGNLFADTPRPPSPRPAARRGKRSLASRVDTPAAKRPKAAPNAVQLQQAEALEELRGDLREAELKIDGLTAKSAQQERLIAHLERFNTLVLEENEELRWLLANGAVEA